MHTRTKIVTAIAIVAVLLTSISIYSLPRLATEQGTPCVTCHVQPDGGGMRNEYGHHSVGFNELTLQSTKRLFTPYKFRPVISENLGYGLDYRMLYLERGDFFRMQTDFYLSLELLDGFSYNLTVGPSNIKYSNLLIKLKDSKYWIRVGRFYPAYGLSDPDHNAYVRTVPQLAPELAVDGISVGGRFFGGSNIFVEFYEPGGQRVATLHSFRAGRLGPVGFLTGLSWRQSEEVNGSYRNFPIARSLFGGLSYDRFTLLAEAGSVGKGNEQKVFYTQLATRIVWGLYLLSEYNYHDPDWDVRSGTNQFYRLSLEFFPVPFVELRPSLTYNAEGPREEEVDWFIQLHLHY